VDLYHSEYGLSIIEKVMLTGVIVAAKVGVHVRNNRHVDGGYKVTSMLFVAKAALR